MFLVSISKQLEIFQEKVYIEVILPEKQDYYLESIRFLNNHVIHFSGDVWKNCCFESFEKFPEKRL